MRRTLLLAALHPAFLLTPGVPADAPQVVPASQPARQTIRVKTVAELVKALGSDRTLELDAEEFRLDEAKRGAGKFFKWDEALDDEYELVIRNCRNLTIKGAGKEPAHIVTGFPYANVLVLKKCANVELVNLKLGHAPDVGACIGGVVKAEECDNLIIRNADLYGCGTEGLTLAGVTNLRFLDSVIHDCSYGILTADDCESLTFDRSRFEQIKEFHGFNFGSSAKISFTDCVVDRISIKDEKSALFRTNLSDEEYAITFKGGEIKNVHALTACNAANMLKAENTKMTGNSWE